MQIVNLRTEKIDIVIVLSGTLAGDISAIQGRNSSPPWREPKQRELSGHVDNRGGRREVGTAQITEHLIFFFKFHRLASKSAIASSATARGAPIGSPPGPVD